MHLWGSVTRVRTASRTGGTWPTGSEHRGRGGEAETAERQAGQPRLGLRIPSTLGGVLASGVLTLSRGAEVVICNNTSAFSARGLLTLQRPSELSQAD